MYDNLKTVIIDCHDLDTACLVREKLYQKLGLMVTHFDMMPEYAHNIKNSKTQFISVGTRYIQVHNINKLHYIGLKIVLKNLDIGDHDIKVHPEGYILPVDYEFEFPYS